MRLPFWEVVSKFEDCESYAIKDGVSYEHDCGFQADSNCDDQKIHSYTIYPLPHQKHYIRYNRFLEKLDRFIKDRYYEEELKNAVNAGFQRKCLRAKEPELAVWRTTTFIMSRTHGLPEKP